MAAGGGPDWGIVNCSRNCHGGGVRDGGNGHDDGGGGSYNGQDDNGNGKDRDSEGLHEGGGGDNVVLVGSKVM